MQIHIGTYACDYMHGSYKCVLMSSLRHIWHTCNFWTWSHVHTHVCVDMCTSSLCGHMRINICILICVKVLKIVTCWHICLFWHTCKSQYCSHTGVYACVNRQGSSKHGNMSQIWKCYTHRSSEHSQMSYIHVPWHRYELHYCNMLTFTHEITCEQFPNVMCMH